MNVSLDRFAYGLPDAQAAESRAECDDCRREIYEGEAVYSGGFWGGDYCAECEIEREEDEE